MDRACGAGCPPEFGGRRGWKPPGVADAACGAPGPPGFGGCFSAGGIEHFPPGPLCRPRVGMAEQDGDMRDEVREKPPPEPQLPPRAPRVRLTAGGEGGPIGCEAVAPVVLLGSRRDCDLPLSHPDISKIHCAIVQTGRHVLVRDLLSRSGTALDGEPVTTTVLRGPGSLAVGPVPVEVALDGVHAVPDDEAAAALGLPAPLTFSLGDAEFVVERNAAIIGRRQTADVVVDHPDVSLVHALVFALDGRPVICDLGSRSGTLLNGEAVRLAWLSPGDEIEVGGQRLAVQWESAPAAEPAPVEQVCDDEPSPMDEAEPLPLPADGAAPPELSPGTLGELEATIAAVHAQVKATRRRLEKQADALRQREKDLDRRAAELEPREAAVEEREARVAEAEQALAQQAAALEERERTLETEQAAVTKQRVELDRLAAELETQRQALAEERAEVERAREEVTGYCESLRAAEAACAAREETLRAAEAELETRRSEVEQQRAALDREQEKLRAEEAACAERAAALRRREEALALRERQHAAAVRKIEQFKTVLRQAGELLATAAPEDGSAATEQVEPAEHPGEESAVHSSDDAPTGRELPAPVVEEPLFSADGVVPPPDWPAELRERFRVLRRMSSKSDAELLKQVWQDRAKLTAKEPGQEPQPVRKKRRLWGG